MFTRGKKMTREISGPLDRYLSILELVAASHRGLTLSEITTLLELPKPTGHRLVAALREAEALETTDVRHKTFVLGRRLQRILALSQDDRIINNCSQLVCDELATQLKETCYVVRLCSESTETVTVATTPHGYRLHVVPGKELPLHAAATAKALLAFQDEQSQRRYLSGNLTRFTKHTKTKVKDVLAELRQVRSLGYAACVREIEPDVLAFSCPVLMPAGVLYSVGVTGPCTRLEVRPTEYWIEALRRGAAKLALMLKTNVAA